MKHNKDSFPILGCAFTWGFCKCDWGEEGGEVDDIYIGNLLALICFLFWFFVLLALICFGRNMSEKLLTVHNSV